MRFLVQINQGGAWRTLARFVSFNDAQQFAGLKCADGHEVRVTVGAAERAA